MKIFLFTALAIFNGCLVRAQALNATITEQTKMEMTGTKSSVVLKAGTVVEVVSKDGDVLSVIYRKIPGAVSAAKTNFKGEAPSAIPTVMAKAETTTKSNEQAIAALPAKAVEAKPTETKSPAPVP